MWNFVERLLVTNKIYYVHLLRNLVIKIQHLKDWKGSKCLLIWAPKRQAFKIRMDFGDNWRKFYTNIAIYEGNYKAKIQKR